MELNMTDGIKYDGWNLNMTDKTPPLYDSRGGRGGRQENHRQSPAGVSNVVRGGGE
jgi:hypothetical protein